MKKEIQTQVVKIGLFAFILVLVGAGCAKVSNTDTTMIETTVLPTMVEDKEDTSQMEKPNEAMVDVKADTRVMMEKENTAIEKKTSGTYQDYAPTKLALAQNQTVVLFFHAPWCPTCKAVDIDIRSELSMIPSGTHILKVDYDSNLELRKKYGVTYQHTFVQVDAEGNMIKKWSGGNTLESVLEKLN